MENKNHLFQVNLKGMISLLSEHIYSNPNTFVRELLQNGIDAITAFRSLDENFVGNIEVILHSDGTMSFTDNGIGLTENDIHQVLTVIGESSKRDSFSSADFIGRFGIGLLSCFVVSNDIIFETRSAITKETIRWCGKADGTYETITLNDERPIGTKVILKPKSEWKHLFEYETFKRNLTYYGKALPYPIFLSNETEREQINEQNPVWLNPNANKEDLLKYGRDEFQSSFLDAFPIKTNAGKITGVIYILPYRTQFSGKLTHKIYLKRMLLGEDDCNLLPSWAFFVKCILNVENLSSTASRESLVNNEELREASKEIGTALKNHLKGLLHSNIDLFNKILDIHYLYIKAIAAEDNELFSLFMDTLPFETNKGTRNFKSIRNNETHIYYTPLLDDFKQIRRIASSQGMLVINAAYTFDEALLKKATRQFDIKIEKISPSFILNSFKEVSYTQHPEYRSFEERCNVLLKPMGVICKLKYFTPADTPVIFVASEKIAQDTSNANNPLNAVLGAFKPKVQKTTPTLCMNANNELILKLTEINDVVVFESIVNILYIQSLLLGKYPVNDDGMNLFNESLYRLIVMGMQDFLGLINKN
ncbi:HSP90 family protein [Bacteroides sp. 519]|uniref:HSP90 family protein n=1 Tax=Bacteroides sp. 519 TaxID=2302937 RepID=UPI0013D6429B|nr:HSP90 family protein [Bacteroides sp. 519]NDV59810.1 HSP90 family protein [Bacteroides sp. 519]